MNKQLDFTFDEEPEDATTSSVQKFLNFIWNSQNKEFIGRDGESWGKFFIF